MPEIGQSISHYKCVKKLGKGGMGEVYRVKDQKLNEVMALKILRSEITLSAYAL